MPATVGKLIIAGNQQKQRNQTTVEKPTTSGAGIVMETPI
jgi:hypothetical protein